MPEHLPKCVEKASERASTLGLLPRKCGLQPIAAPCVVAAAGPARGEARGAKPVSDASVAMRGDSPAAPRLEPLLCHRVAATSHPPHDDLPWLGGADMLEELPEPFGHTFFHRAVMRAPSNVSERQDVVGWAEQSEWRDPMLLQLAAAVDREGSRA